MPEPQDIADGEEEKKDTFADTSVNNYYHENSHHPHDFFADSVSDLDTIFEEEACCGGATGDLGRKRWESIRNDNRTSILTDADKERISVAIKERLDYCHSCQTEIDAPPPIDKLRLTHLEKQLEPTRSHVYRNIGKSSQSFLSAEKYHIDCEDSSYVRLPCLKNLIKNRKVVRQRYRYANAQVDHTLKHPTLPQPKDDNEEAAEDDASSEESPPNEMKRTRPSHRFVICADTQFGILMDGYAMTNPNWDKEIGMSRQTVEEINALDPAPLFVSVCGDLIDTNASFCSVVPSWKQGGCGRLNRISTVLFGSFQFRLCRNCCRYCYEVSVLPSLLILFYEFKMYASPSVVFSFPSCSDGALGG